MDDQEKRIISLMNTNYALLITMREMEVEIENLRAVVENLRNSNCTCDSGIKRKGDSWAV